MDSFQGRAGAVLDRPVLEFDALLVDRGLANLDHQCVINRLQSD